MPDAAFHPLENDLQLLDQVSRAASAPDFLRLAIRGAYRDRIALVVSDGSPAAVLLHMVSEIDRSPPIIFLDTGKHFGETLGYDKLSSGGMGAVQTNLSKLPESDVQAIAEYLVSLK